ncbi:MAG: class I SAM-dependent methyltransferase [bacterium]|nr:class I SAM-dependent methyltransferase [bacterium]
MNPSSYEIKDECRKNLSKYTIQAFSLIPEIENPVLLDIGCGSGVATVALAEKFNGMIYAVDPDQSSLNRLKEKVAALDYADRFKIIHGSLFDNSLVNNTFDIVVAEGLLNVVGFEKGLPALMKLLKKNGYLLIHDELKNDSEKRKIFRKNDLVLLDIFQLDSTVWWDEYYCCLEAKIKSIDNDSLFGQELNEINECKKNPDAFQSIYYILQSKPL